jgi:hypothetical protein
MIIQDEKGGPLYKYVEKDIKAAEAAVKWISEFPGVLLHVPDMDFTFVGFFDEDQIKNFQYLCIGNVRERVFKMLNEDDFWEEADENIEDKGDKVDELLDELYEVEGLDQVEGVDEDYLYDKLTESLFKKLVGGLHEFGEEDDTESGEMTGDD